MSAIVLKEPPSVAMASAVDSGAAARLGDCRSGNCDETLRRSWLAPPAAIAIRMLDDDRRSSSGHSRAESLPCVQILRARTTKRPTMDGAANRPVEARLVDLDTPIAATYCPIGDAPPSMLDRQPPAAFGRQPPPRPVPQDARPQSAAPARPPAPLKNVHTGLDDRRARSARQLGQSPALRQSTGVRAWDAHIDDEPVAGQPAPRHRSRSGPSGRRAAALC